MQLHLNVYVTSNGVNIKRYSPNMKIMNSITIERRTIAISGSLIWSKTLMEFIFIPCGEFRWSREGRVSQIHSLRVHVGAPGIFSDLLRSVQMLKREICGKQRELLHLFIPSKTATLVPESAVEDLSWAELQPTFLHLQWRTYPWAEHSWW